MTNEETILYEKIVQTLDLLKKLSNAAHNFSAIMEVPDGEDMSHEAMAYRELMSVLASVREAGYLK